MGGNPGLEIEDGLLLYQEQLIVPDINNLWIELIRKAYY